MEETFIHRDPLPADRLRTLMKREDAASLRRMVVQCALLLLSFGAVIYAPSGPWKWAAIALHGVCHFPFFALLHETCHRTAFTRRGMNTFGGWIAALSQPMTPALMRAFHFAHHRHTHDVELDPELARMPMMLRWPRHIVWLGTMTGLHLAAARGGWALFAALTPRGRLWELVLPFVEPKARRRIAWEARVLVGIHAALITVGFTLWSPLLGYYAGLLIGHSILGVYTVCEHRGLPSGGSVEERTRSIHTTGLVRWLLWNMPYHAEHHAWPAVPWHALPALHREVRDHLPHKAHGIWALYWRRGRD